MRCGRCGHEAAQHEDAGCRIRIMTGWDETIKGFTGERPCGCARYVEPYHAQHSDCPHEFVKADPNLCVHCGRKVAVESEY